MEPGNRLLNRLLSQPHSGAVAVDPGGTSGIAWVGRDGDVVSTTQVPMDETVAWIERLLGDSEPEEYSTMVIERHIPLPGKPQSGDAMRTMELVGALAETATRYGVEIVYHTASQMKTVHWCNLGAGVHARDAAKHLVRWLMDSVSDHGKVRLKPSENSQ